MKYSQMNYRDSELGTQRLRCDGEEVGKAVSHQLRKTRKPGRDYMLYYNRTLTFPASSFETVMTRLVVSKMIISNILALKHADPCECALNYKDRLVTRKAWCFAILACYAQTDGSGFYNMRTPHSRPYHLRREVIENFTSC